MTVPIFCNKYSPPFLVGMSPSYILRTFGGGTSEKYVGGANRDFHPIHPIQPIPSELPRNTTRFNYNLQSNSLGPVAAFSIQLKNPIMC